MASDNRYRQLRRFFRSPARLSIIGFGVLILTGTAALMLPAASRRGAMGFVDALFTATSASCVTGLAVVDTGTALTLFGQGVVLALIQIGGLGIMTISTLVMLLVGRPPGLTGQVVIKDAFTHSGDRRMGKILRDVVTLTLVIETLGAAVLFMRFKATAPAAQALWQAAFHSISAFCNAGFCLFSDSLAAYRNDWVINLTICLLIICGGIGFLVLSEIIRQRPLSHRSWSRMSLHTKMVITVTAVLLLISTIAFALMEWQNTLQPLAFKDRWLAAFFQAVTARTAGFNTLTLPAMANETLFVMMALMFIGAAPGSCGGGVKITSMAALFITGWSNIRGRHRPQLFHRTISKESVERAMTLILTSTVIVIVGALLMMITETGNVPHPASRGKFLELLFETVSAFGTVGLSTGLTATLTAQGKLVLCAMMFIGRLGPMAIAVAISRSTRTRFYHAEETIMIG